MKTYGLDTSPGKNLNPKMMLVFILLFSLLMHVVFFVGYCGSHPQDDAAYYQEAYVIYKGNFRVEQYKQLVESEEIERGDVNPGAAFGLRTGMIFPMAFFFGLFGPGEVTASLFTIMCSLGSVVLIFFLGRCLFNVFVGLMASFLLALFPLQPIFGTRILSDIPVAFFMGLSVMLFIRALQIEDPSRKTNRFPPGLYAFGAGLALGVAYLIKIVAVVILPVLLVYVVACLLKRKRIYPHTLLYLLGFALIFSAEGFYYLINTGDFLLHYHVIDSAHAFKFKYEKVQVHTVLPFFQVLTNGIPFSLFRAMICRTLFPRGVNLVGAYFIVLFFVIPFFLIKKKNLFLIFWVAFIYFYLEFGFFKLSYDPANSTLRYFMIPTNPRFLALVAFPAILLISDFLYTLSRHKKTIFYGVMALVIISSSLAIGKNHQFYRNSLSDLRQISGFISKHPNKEFYIDYVGRIALEILSGHELNNLRLLEQDLDYDDLDDAFVIVGGSRGNEVLSEWVMELLPSKIREYVIDPESVPITWQPVLKVKGKKESVRLYDLTVYYVNQYPKRFQQASEMDRSL